MIIRTFTQCHACGSPATRVARYSTHRREQTTNRYRCGGCGQVFEQKAEPMKMGKLAGR